MWPFPHRHYLLRTPLTPEQCIQRLKTRLPPGYPLLFAGRENPIGGWVSGTGFKLANRFSFTTPMGPIRFDYAGPLRMFATGQFLPAPTGTLIRVRLGTSRFTVFFLFFWSAAWIVIPGWWVWQFIRSGALLDQWFWLAVMFLLLVATMLLPFIGGGLLARMFDDSSFLLQFLCETLEAREALDVQQQPGFP